MGWAAGLAGAGVDLTGGATLGVAVTGVGGFGVVVGGVMGGRDAGIGTVDHTGTLNPAELKLIAEWLDIGGQYYNNPFAVPQ